MKKGIIIGIMIGALIFVSIGVYAGTLLSKDIVYTKKDGTVTNVDAALTELYNSSSVCESGVFTTTDSCATSEGCVIFEGFNPKIFVTKYTVKNFTYINYYNKDENENYVYQNNTSYLLTAYYRIENNKLIYHNVSNSGLVMNYVVCK